MWGDFDLLQHLCSKEMLQWVSVFNWSPKETRRRCCFLFENGDPEVSEGLGFYGTVCGKQSLMDICYLFCLRANLWVWSYLRRECRWPHSLCSSPSSVSLAPPQPTPYHYSILHRPYSGLIPQWGLELGSLTPTLCFSEHSGYSFWRTKCHFFLPPASFPSPTLAWRGKPQDCASLSSLPRALISSQLSNLDLCPNHSLAW